MKTSLTPNVSPRVSRAEFISGIAIFVILFAVCAAAFFGGHALCGQSLLWEVVGRILMVVGVIGFIVVLCIAGAAIWDINDATKEAKKHHGRATTMNVGAPFVPGLHQHEEDS